MIPDPVQAGVLAPGLGIWQYDTAGLGAPLTTIEAMDVRVIAGRIATLMATKYCNPSSAQIGHAAPYSVLERRYSAWGDWGFPCTLCEQFFQEMVSTTPDSRTSTGWRGSARWAG